MDKSKGDPVGDAVAWVETGAKQREESIKAEIKARADLEQHRFNSIMERLKTLEEAVSQIQQILLKNEVISLSKLIFVSSRLPYHITNENGEYKSQLSVSGLVTGVQSFFQSHEGVWIGFSGEPNDRKEKTKHLVKEWEKDNYFAVSVPNDTITYGLESFCNRSLWSLFHNFIDYVEFDREEYEGYVEWNKIFVNKILEHYKAGDTILIQDFQLMLVPKLLREHIPNAQIRYFQHINWCGSDIFERLPVGKELIEGLLGADYIGFHTKGHVKNFLRSAKRVGLDPSNANVQENPIGIDPFFWENEVKTTGSLERADWMKQSFGNKKIILAVERLDFVKGIKQRIQSYEYLLKAYPELQGNVTLVQVAVHSRTGTPIYDTIGEEVDRAVSRLNGQYSSLDWTPIRYLNSGFSQEELASLYSISEVACITPLIDGLNLVSKEYVISGDDNRALILSKFAGSAEELTEAYIVNPYDIDEVGQSMYTALNNPNVGKLKPIVKQNSVFDWAERLLGGIK